MLSTLRGLNRGIKVLSNISMVLCFMLLIATLFMLPFKEYFDSLKSDIADFRNAGGRAAGTITGGTRTLIRED